MKNITVGVPVGCVIAHDRRSINTELSLDLSNKVNDLSAINFEADSQCIMLV
jgi:hypothetical protein